MKSPQSGVEFKIQIAAKQGQQTCTNGKIDFSNDESQIRKLLLQLHMADFYFHFTFTY